jgi:hypothetical protein
LPKAPQVKLPAPGSGKILKQDFYRSSINNCLLSTAPRQLFSTFVNSVSAGNKPTD